MVRLPLLACLREAEARMLRRLMKVRAARPVYGADPERWLKAGFEMDMAQVALEQGIADLDARFEQDPETGGLYIHASGAGEECTYGPVLWHLPCPAERDVLSRRGIGYVLRHTDLL